MDTLLARNVSDSRPSGSETEPLAEITLGFEPASLNLLFGGPCSGRNHLLRLLGLIQRPEAGEILVDGESTRDWSDEQCADFRNRHFGFVFGSPLLLPSFNVAENIAMPLFKLTEATPEQAREETQRVLAHVGLADHGESAVDELPLWAQQRVNLARALVTRPQVLFVENLDTLFHDTELISLLELLSATRRTLGVCIIVTAASRDLIHFAQRAVEMEAGRVVRDWHPGGLLS